MQYTETRLDPLSMMKSMDNGRMDSYPPLDMWPQRQVSWIKSFDSNNKNNYKFFFPKDSLVESANALVQGNASEEKLISAAKQVASSTASLLVACKVKSGQDSTSMNRLQQAGNAVKKATEMLVRAAQKAKEIADEEDEQSIVISKRKVPGKFF